MVCVVNKSLASPTVQFFNNFMEDAPELTEGTVNLGQTSERVKYSSDDSVTEEWRDKNAKSTHYQVSLGVEECCISLFLVLMVVALYVEVMKVVVGKPYCMVVSFVGPKLILTVVLQNFLKCSL